MRIALLMNLAPRKLGSFEGWLVEFCREARRRGHTLDVLGKRPVHPEFARSLGEMGVEWDEIDELELDPVEALARLRGYDVLHLNMFAPRSFVALLAYAAWPARVLFVDRTGGQPVGLGPQPGALRALLSKTADRLTMVRVNALAGVSDFVRDRNRARFSLDERRARTIYNGVDTRRFSPGPARQAAPALVLTIAHLIPEKGVDHLLHAFAQMRHREARLRIAGDGPQASHLAQLAAELGLEGRVDLVGLTNDVPALLKEADIYVHPTLAEAFGLAIAEAMATGLPVVASRLGGIPELVEDGVSGLLVEPRDSKAIARAIDLLLDVPELRMRLGRNARTRAVERFDVRGCARAHLLWCEEHHRRRGPLAALFASRPAGGEAGP
jgi:glycosyltransferase involved in cell wall biosynthesis